MSVATPEPTPSIEVTAEAREQLLAHVAKDPVRHRYVRIHAGRG